MTRPGCLCGSETASCSRSSICTSIPVAAKLVIDGSRADNVESVAAIRSEADVGHLLGVSTKRTKEGSGHSSMEGPAVLRVDGDDRAA